MEHLTELGAGDIALMIVGHLVDEVRLFGGVAGAEEEQAIAGESVAPGTAGFLVVAFDVLGEIVVNHPAHVGFVDPHAEGDGRAHDAHVVAEEGFLVASAFFGGESGVVRTGGEAAGGEGLGGALGGGTRGAINDAAFFGALFDPFGDLASGSVFGENFVGKVGTVEGRHVDTGIAQAKVSDDIRANPLGRGGGEGHDGHLGQDVAKLGDLAEFGTKVVPPLGDAVGLVDGDGGDFPTGEIFLPLLEHEALGGYVEKSKLAAVEAGHAGAGFGGREGGIQECGRNAGRLKLIDLIFHQGDERGDYDGESPVGPDEGGELEAHRLATAGGEQGKGITPREVTLDDLPLERAKFVVSKDSVQRIE